MKKNISIFLAVSLVLSAMLTGCGKQTDVTEDSVKVTDENASVKEASQEASTGTKETIKEGPDITVFHHHLSCQKDGKEWAYGRYPEIILGDSYSENYPKLREYLDKTNAGWSEQTTTYVQEYGKWAIEDTFYDDPVFYSDIVASVSRADDRLFTIMIGSYDWGGGAHPNHSSASLNIDPVSGTELTLMQILGDSSRLSEGIRKELEKNYPGVMEEVDSFYFPDENDDPDQFVNKLKENTYTFAVTDKGLSIFFSPYEIASYATGDLEVTLSYEEYPELVQKAYVMDKPEDLDKMVEYIDDENDVTFLEPKEQVEEVEQQYIDNPSFSYYLSDDAAAKADKHISLSKQSEKKTDWLDTYAWCDRNGFVQANACHEDDNYYYDPYDPVEFDYMYNSLHIYDKNMDNMLYDLGLLKICNGPDDEKGTLTASTEYIRYATVYEGVLYVEVAHSGYASEEPRTGYMLAIDLNTFKVLFRSEPLVANGGNFKIVDDTIICGYGFTAEPDYIYLLDRFTGEKVDTIPINSAADQFEVVGDTLYVATYNTEYTFKIER